MIPKNWHKHQHGHARDYPWIKNYLRLLTDPEYCSLPLAARGILHGCWLLAGKNNGRVPTDFQLTLRMLSGRRHRYISEHSIGGQISWKSFCANWFTPENASTEENREEENRIETTSTRVLDKGNGASRDAPYDYSREIAIGLVGGWEEPGSPLDLETRPPGFVPDIPLRASPA
jgi:hypothetical protein